MPRLLLSVTVGLVYVELLAVLWKRANGTEKTPGRYVSVLKAAACMYVGVFQKPCMPEDRTQRRYLLTHTWRLSGLVFRAQKEEATPMSLAAILKDGVSGTGAHLLCFFFSFLVWV